MRFQGRVVAVTGASKGIGRATAVRFGQEGARVALLDVDAEGSRSVVDEVKTAGGQAIFLQADVSREDDVRRAVEQVMQAWGRLDVLVNNAGIYVQGDAAETPTEAWQRVLATNLTGAFLTIKYAIPAMERTGGGAIINIASEAGLVGIQGQVAYNVSKGGVVALTRSCAVDLAGRGIRVNCVCPGTTDTPLVQAAVGRSPDPAAARRRLEQARPLNRLGTPEEIAAAILFLASDEVAYATGSILSVDGGYTAQ